MLNPISAYTEAGTKAAQARNHQDESTCHHWSQWARSACALERPEFRADAQGAFATAYSNARRCQPSNRYY
jgi:hypothetical protein